MDTRRILTTCLAGGSVAMTLCGYAAVLAAEKQVERREPEWVVEQRKTVVPEERAAFDEVRRLYGGCGVAESGHITDVSVNPWGPELAKGADLGFLADMPFLEKVTIHYDVPVTPHGLDVLAKLKRVTQLELTMAELGDEQMAAVGKMPALRKLMLNATKTSVGALAPLENVRSLEWLELTGGIDDAPLAGIARARSLKTLLLENAKVTDEGLKAVEDLVNLEVIYPPTRTSDDGLRHLQKLVKLRRIGWSHRMKITDRGLAYLSNLTELEDVDLTAMREITDEGLKSLEQMTNLRSLNLAGNKVTDAGLAHLHGMTKLEILELGMNDVGDDGLRHLQALPKLRDLSLSFNNVSDEGMKAIGRLQNLDILDLSATKVTDKGLRELLPLRGLKGLCLNGNAGVTDAGAETLGKMVGLTGLSLNRTQIGNEGLARLAPLQNLKSLGIGWCNLSDAGLVHLSAFPRLRRLSLQHDHITDAGVATLERLKLEQLTMRDTDLTAAGASRLSRALGGINLDWQPEGAGEPFD